MLGFKADFQNQPLFFDAELTINLYLLRLIFLLIGNFINF